MRPAIVRVVTLNRLKPVSALSFLKWSTQSNNQLSLRSLSSLLHCPWLHAWSTLSPDFTSPGGLRLYCLLGLVSRMWLVSTDRPCSAWPREGTPPALRWCLAETTRRAASSAVLMLGRGPEKGHLQRCVDAWPRPREGPPPASFNCLVGALKRAAPPLVLVFSRAPKRAAVRPM